MRYCQISLWPVRVGNIIVYKIIFRHSLILSRSELSAYNCISVTVDVGAYEDKILN